MRRIWWRMRDKRKQPNKDTPSRRGSHYFMKGIPQSKVAPNINSCYNFLTAAVSFLYVCNTCTEYLRLALARKKEEASPALNIIYKPKRGQSAHKCVASDPLWPVNGHIVTLWVNATLSRSSGEWWREKCRMNQWKCADEARFSECKVEICDVLNSCIQDPTNGPRSVFTAVFAHKEKHIILLCTLG